MYILHFGEVINGNPDLMLCFLSFIEHYLDAYKIIEVELLERIKNFTEGIVMMEYETLNYA